MHDAAITAENTDAGVTFSLTILYKLKGKGLDSLAFYEKPMYMHKELVNPRVNEHHILIFLK